IRLLPRSRVLVFGLLGNFLCVDALNTLILFITVYVQKTVYQGGADPERSVTVLFIALILSSFLASFVNGRLADRIGSMKTLLVSAVFLLIALVFGVLTTAYSTVFFWGVVLTGGMGLTGFWIAGRKMIAEYSPVEHRGLFFGLYGMVTKVGALTTISFALATWMLPEFGIAEATAYRIGMATLLVPVIIGLFLLSKVWSATPPPPGEVNLAQRDIPV
ncbi:MAG: MFS transporter, partial [Candidatus Brocadiia bacterium]